MLAPVDRALICALVSVNSFTCDTTALEDAKLNPVASGKADEEGARSVRFGFDI